MTFRYIYEGFAGDKSVTEGNGIDAFYLYPIAFLKATISRPVGTGTCKRQHPELNETFEPVVLLAPC